MSAIGTTGTLPTSALTDDVLEDEVRIPAAPQTGSHEAYLKQLRNIHDSPTPQTSLGLESEPFKKSRNRFAEAQDWLELSMTGVEISDLEETLFNRIASALPVGGFLCGGAVVSLFDFIVTGRVWLNPLVSIFLGVLGVGLLGVSFASYRTLKRV